MIRCSAIEIPSFSHGKHCESFPHRCCSRGYSSAPIHKEQEKGMRARGLPSGRALGRSAKSEGMTFVHFTRRPLRAVILSAAKNLSERPFTSFRVTLSVSHS